MFHLGFRNLARILGCASALLVVQAFGQNKTDLSLPRIVEEHGRYALFVDGAPFLMLGMQVNNSSAWPAMLPKVWPAVEYLHANTVEAPIYWEQLEPKPGQFDYTVLDTLLTQARDHHVRLVLLWFGTWKNGSGHYTPEWIKKDNSRYPRMIGKTGRNVDSLSPLGTFTVEADRTAFAALMRHLKAADPEHTVMMVQVENESGTWGSIRDYSPAAEKLFSGGVPEALLKALHKQPGTWQQVFGDDADEFFHAWSVAHDIEQVAAAGKAAYPLPMYANASLRDPTNPGKAGSYESGGPTDNVLMIWKAAAPSIDVLAPDIYLREYDKYIKVLDLYHRPDNAMFVPETGNGPDFARYFFAALGHQAIGFSPFGLDYTGYGNFPLGASRVDEKTLEPFALNYQIVGPMQREIARLNFEGKVQAVSESPDVHQTTLDFGSWKVVVSFGQPQFGFGKAPAGNPEPAGGALIAQLGENEFLVTAVHARVDFEPSASGQQRQFLRAEEGGYHDGKWQFSRVWNGDQTDYGLNFTSALQTLRVTMATY
jgi:beta-galactosidase GanA